MRIGSARSLLVALLVVVGSASLAQAQSGSSEAGDEDLVLLQRVVDAP